MKRIKKSFRLVCFCLTLSLATLTGLSQNKNDMKTTSFDKQVKYFSEKYSKETPMDAFVSICYMTINGKMSMLRPYSTYRFYQFLPKENTPDQEIPENFKNEVLNREVKECIIYRDSTAAIITTSAKDSSYLIRYLSKENGEWLNAGESGEKGLAKAKESATNNLATLASYISQIEVITQTPKDTVNFEKYIKSYGMQPPKYILEKLEKHKLVIYGEMHRRKVSWDLLRQVIADSEFAKTTGTVFMEFASCHQKALDQFYAKEDLDQSILLDIFRSQQINGWYDKDQFDFMIALRELNKKLPDDKKIKVVFADYQAPWASIETVGELQNYLKEDRNTHMADIIEHTMKTTADQRNALFIVGFMHAYKSSDVLGMASTPEGMAPAPSAGAQLVERFSNEDVFCIFPHCASISNMGHMGGKIRNGLFDYVFETNNNIPVAFDLKNSPFGREPFDACVEVKFDPRIGSYENNYDGYIFFQKLEDEEKGTPLLEIFTDDFMIEMKRRAAIYGINENMKWYNVPIKDMNKEDVMNTLNKQTTGKQWSFND